MHGLNTLEKYVIIVNENNLTKISKNFPTSLGSEMNCESESEHK